jgi:hypothetical protein
MGLLTTITFRNDNAHHIEENPDEVMEVINKAMGGVRPNEWDNEYIVQETRHANNDTLYFHHGNTVTDVWKLDHEGMIDSCIEQMKMHLKRLKDKKKELNNGKEQKKEST